MDTPTIKPARWVDPTEAELLAADRAYDAEKDRRAERHYERMLNDQQQYLATTGQLEGWR